MRGPQQRWWKGKKGGWGSLHSPRVRGGAHSIRLGRERTRAVERHRSMEAEGERGRPFGLIAAVFLSEDTTKFLKRCFFIMERSIGLLGLFGTVSNQHTTSTGICSIIKFNPFIMIRSRGSFQSKATECGPELTTANNNSYGCSPTPPPWVAAPPEELREE